MRYSELCWLRCDWWVTMRILKWIMLFILIWILISWICTDTDGLTLTPQTIWIWHWHWNWSCTDPELQLNHNLNMTMTLWMWTWIRICHLKRPHAALLANWRNHVNSNVPSYAICYLTTPNEFEYEGEVWAETGTVYEDWYEYSMIWIVGTGNETMI